MKGTIFTCRHLSLLLFCMHLAGCASPLQTPPHTTQQAPAVRFSLSSVTLVGLVQELVKEGLIKGIGLSEISAADIRKAHAVHPITAIEMEWSLFSRDAEVCMDV